MLLRTGGGAVAGGSWRKEDQHREAEGSGSRMGEERPKGMRGGTCIQGNTGGCSPEHPNSTLFGVWIC